MMKKCQLCGGDFSSGKTTVTVDLGDGVVVLREVPAEICRQCGEEWIDDRIAKEIEILVKRARRDKAQFEVLSLK